MIEINKIYRSDCFDIFPKIDDNTIDIVLVDLPFGCTSNDWDVKINLDKMRKQLKRICKSHTTYIFTVQKNSETNLLIQILIGSDMISYIRNQTP